MHVSFAKKKKRKAYHRLNRESCRFKARERYHDNQERRKAYAREYYRNNKQKCREKCDSWQSENMDVVRRIQKEFMSANYNNNENFRKAHLIRTRINHAYKILVNKGYCQIAKNRDIDYYAILKHLGTCPGEHGRTNGKYVICYNINLRLLDLSDPTDFAIGVHPENVKWALFEDYCKMDCGWNDKSLELYSKLLNEVRGTKHVATKNLPKV